MLYKCYISLYMLYNMLYLLYNIVLYNMAHLYPQHREDEYVFFYQQKCDNRFYQVSCEIVPPLLVDSCLNKNFLGIELQNQNMEQEHLAFTSGQKDDLEYHLRQYLSQHF